jgi:1-acyl-sn-glycerol-3-phosphate acyltransferase
VSPEGRQESPGVFREADVAARRKAPPPRTPWFLALARRYARRRLARGLDGLFVDGLESARAVVQRQPVILAANHVGWWDSFLVVALDEALGTEGYALMDAESVRRLPFFARLGALPLERGGQASARAGLQAAAARLDRPGRALWIFPQGRHRPAHLRPLGFEPGIRLLARLVPHAAVIPVAFQYAFAERPAPAAFARLGDAIPAQDLAIDAIERSVEDGLARIDRMLAGRAPAFPALVAPKGGGPDRGFGARLIGGRGE